MPAASAPTLQTKGYLSVGLNLDYNVTRADAGPANVTGMAVKLEPVQYGPLTAPGSPWTNGKQYFSGDGQAFGTMGIVTYPNQFSQQPGIYSAVQIMDMSNKTATPGKTYAFAFTVGYEWIQLYFMIAGGPNGSIVLPGFGLWSLSGNPKGWTDVTPDEPFTGEWKIGLLNPASFAVVWLSVEYAPPKDYYGEPDEIESRLVFTASGSERTDRYIFRQPNAPPERAEKTGGMQFIHDRSDAYVLHKGPKVPVS